jgi:hypothetical protein
MMNNREVTSPSLLLLLLFLLQHLSPVQAAFLTPSAANNTPRQGGDTKLGSFSAAVAVADTFWKTSPYAAAALTCAVKGSVADLVAQKYFQSDADTYTESESDDSSSSSASLKQRQRSNNLNSNSKGAVRRNGRFHHWLSARTAARRQTTSALSSSVAISSSSSPKSNSSPKADWKRNIAYALYGSIYQGIMQEYMFNQLYPMLFGVGTDVRTVAAKVAFNLFVHAPLITIPIAYLVKAALYQDSAHDAFAKYWNDIRHHGLLTKFFLLWGPVQSLTFSVIPQHLRVTFIAAVSFFWMIILSSTASKPKA